MTEKEAFQECICKVLKTINKYLENDKGALDFVSMSDEYVLTLSFKGSCIKEMIEDAVDGKLTGIMFIKESKNH